MDRHYLINPSVDQGDGHLPVSALRGVRGESTRDRTSTGRENFRMGFRGRLPIAVTNGLRTSLLHVYGGYLVSFGRLDRATQHNYRIDRRPLVSLADADGRLICRDRCSHKLCTELMESGPTSRL